VARNQHLLTRHIDNVVANIRSKQPADAAAAAMASTMRTATIRYIGVDLKMSGFPGAPVTFPTKLTTAERAVLELGGSTYALANEGRKTVRPRIYAEPFVEVGRRPALATPKGYRRSVKGSTWPGFRITERHGSEALAAGVKAAQQVIEQLAVK
jgi:hypothetical protein